MHYIARMKHDLLVLGGTFDPVHYGHLRALEEVREALGLPRALLIPAGHPPHRQSPWAPAHHRLEMVRRAVRHYPQLAVCSFEVERDGPSFTVDTLRHLRAEHGAASLSMVIGMDAFLRFDTWREWERILDLTHLVVTGRPGWPAAELPEALRQALYQRRCADLAELREEASGKIAFFQVTALEISATRIRSLLAAGRSAAFLLPEAVLEYIVAEKLYRSP